MMRSKKHLALPLVAVLAACAGPSVRPERSEGTTSTATPTSKANSNSTATATATAKPPVRPEPTAAQSKGEGAAPQATPAKPPARTLSPRAQRAFEDALAAREDMRRMKVPVDWEVLERRWRAVNDVEDVPEAWFNVGVALDQRGRADEARAAYRRALELDPGLAAAAVNLALLEEPKDPREAGATWAELVRRFPQDAVPRARLAALYEASGQLDDANRFAREALVRDPRSAEALKVMMRVALARGNADLAQLLALKAQKLAPGDPELAAFTGDLLAKRGDDAAARAEWKKALAMKADYLPARYRLLGSALAKRHWEGVAEEARAILAAEPADARVQLALGIAYRYLGQPDKALAAYDQAEKLGGDGLPEVHLARGVALMKSKEQCQPAIAELRRYVAQAGPMATEGPALKLARECEGILAANKQAEEAAREMKAEAEREAAKAAAPNAKEARTTAATGGDVAPTARPTAAPRTESPAHPTR
ncbi:MAG: adventurous gliding motility TPR repeat lipoprotein GltE [Anaeromyxobacteraceae bacterium]